MPEWVNRMLQSWLIREGVPWAIERGLEPSTWAGLGLMLATQLHLATTDSEMDAFIKLGLALTGLVAIVRKEGVNKS